MTRLSIIGIFLFQHFFEISISLSSLAVIFVFIMYNWIKNASILDIMHFPSFRARLYQVNNVRQ